MCPAWLRSPSIPASDRRGGREGCSRRQYLPHPEELTVVRKGRGIPEAARAHVRARTKSEKGSRVLLKGRLSDRKLKAIMGPIGLGRSGVTLTDNAPPAPHTATGFLRASSLDRQDRR